MLNLSFTTLELEDLSLPQTLTCTRLFENYLFDAKKTGNFLTLSIDQNTTFQWQEGDSGVDGSTIVVVGQGLNLWVLSQLCFAIAGKDALVECSASNYYMTYAKQVLRLTFSETVLPSQAQLLDVAEQFHVDLHVKPEKTSLSKPGLLVMDMDSTIIDIECIDEIGALANVKEKISEVTEQAMRGEIAFTDSLKYRVACLEGVAIDKLNSIRSRLPFMPGFLATMRVLQQHEWYLAIASGGFTYFADYVQAVAGLNEAHSNTLEVKDGKLTGKVIGNIVDGDKKASILKSLQQNQNIAEHQTVAMGDGANDLIMMGAADLGVAYHAKPTVQESADVAINVGTFESLLYILE
ncbi:phosphoserine phosphatase SerB [Agaribacter marinus]|uniref:Phosphoserine phosphatase n=1 Tax=Agaribacter marinus TaxID=1431249 RepID=A0AA37WJC0_9ALTE|nr:phosphoserine phosphatase SerB [Agaribacter marinus]GLR73051.1 hypothetical protein GCM10007852_39590 [Agaribacter marinus]